MDKRIAFLGLGLMGAPMTINLHRSGAALTAWNRTPDRPGVHQAQTAGVAIAETLAAAVTQADIIFTCLGDVPDVEAVLLSPDGVAELAQPNALIVDMSTIGPVAAKAIAAELAQRELRFMDAPVSGGDVGAQAGTLTIMAGGTAADFAECQPYFQAMGKNSHLCGPVGSGQGVKMCNQILCALNMVGLCEALTLAEAQQLDPNLVVEVCGSGAAGSWTLSNLGPKILAQNLAPGFSIQNILKDLRLVRECADGDYPGTELAQRLFQQVAALKQGAGANLGTQGMIRYYQDPSTTDDSNF